jgi:RNA ligase (TIGR02306 family)
MLTSEFTCEVVRVTEILPHPNADRLEIIRFSTKDGGPSAYSLVHGKDQLKVGDLGVYVSVDALVPVEGPLSDCWQFLKTRLDYRKGSGTYRIKAANLRGTYSEGIMLIGDPIGDAFSIRLDGGKRIVTGEYGDDMSKDLGIVKYERPDPFETRDQAPAVPRTSKKINPSLFPVYEILSYRKSPYAIRDGTSVLFTEKIHGCNFRAGYLPVGLFGAHEFVVGSHRAEKTDRRSWFRRIYDYLTGKSKTFKHWYGEDVWTVTAIRHQLKQRMKHYPGIVLYGEIFGKTPSGKALQDLTYGQTLQFRVIDAYNSKTGTWLTWTELVHLASDLEVDVIPVLKAMDWSEEARKFMIDSAERQSSIDPNTIMEGYVIRTLDSRIKMKYVSKQYSLRTIDNAITT